jgi:hypothetical protein
MLGLLKHDEIVVETKVGLVYQGPFRFERDLEDRNL